MLSIEKNGRLHILNMKNDAIMQIVSVFADSTNISTQKQVVMHQSLTLTLTGQIALTSDGFKNQHLVKMIHHISVILLHQEQSLRNQ